MGGRGVLGTIGGTPLVKLRKVVPPGCAEVFVKVEGRNPTGSMKDRMAQSMIARAEGDGRLLPPYGLRLLPAALVVRGPKAIGRGGRRAGRPA